MIIGLLLVFCTCLLSNIIGFATGLYAVNKYLNEPSVDSIMERDSEEVRLMKIP